MTTKRQDMQGITKYTRDIAWPKLQDAADMLRAGADGADIAVADALLSVAHVLLNLGDTLEYHLRMDED